MADSAVVSVHINFHQNGSCQYQDDDRAAFDWLRCADLVNGGTDQLKAHDQNCNRDKKPGDVFHSSMSEGVLGVRFLSGELKAYKGNHRRAGV